MNRRDSYDIDLDEVKAKYKKKGVNTRDKMFLDKALILTCGAFLFTVLFGGFWLMTIGKTKVSEDSIPNTTSELLKVNLPDDDQIYNFSLRQIFPTGANPLYSELEIELLDENLNHVYSFYKVLWQEKYPNENGRYQIYNDLNIEFLIEVQKAGVYYLRPISHNDNTGGVSVNVRRKARGSLYFKFYTILFGILGLILYFGRDFYGAPSDIFKEIRSLKNVKQNKFFWYILLGFSSAFILCVVMSITHYGYASYGDQSILPTYFFSNNNVIYLG